MTKKMTLKLFYLCLMLLFGLPNIAQAQFTASGTVNDENNEPLLGVAVLVKESSTGTVTDIDGKYSIEIPTESATLVFSFLGYADVEYDVSSTSNTFDLVMAESSTVLNEIVITGLGSTVKRSNSANSVASISASKLVGVTSQSTFDGALYGKFKGAEIRANSGAPGGGISLKLRGVTSIFGNQQPLYIIDGIYVDNSTITLGTNVVSAAAGGGNTSSTQDDASNRIADIDPEDIETIEILKGASAAAIYGSRAGAGVVIINTKQGKANEHKVSFSQTFGTIRPTKLLGTRGWDEAKVRTAFGDADAEVFSQNGETDYEKELYDKTGFSSTSRIELSGGTEKTTYFIGGTYKNEDGIVDNTGYERTDGRVNLRHKFNEIVDISLSNYYVNSTSDRGFFNNGNNNTTIGYALAFSKPWTNLFPDESGNYPANPAVGSNVLETVALTTNREEVNRYIGGITANVHILSRESSNLKLILRGGLDQYTLRSTGIFPQQLSFYRDPASLSGVSISGNTVNTNTNMAAILVHSYYTPSGLNFRTQAGITQEDFDRNIVITTATGLNGSQTNLDQSTNVSVYQDRRPQQDKGFFVQEEVNWNDRIIATVGLRGDKSSNNGDANKLYYYPKANVAFNLHEFDFWTVEDVSTLKARVAFGQSGNFPGFTARFNTLQGTLIDGNSGLQTDVLRGNADVGPERQTETEFGIDLGLMNNKFVIDFTYYIKNVEDLLLEAEVPTSTGFIRQALNAGELENKGFEIGLNATPVSTKDFRWETVLSFWKNTSEVTKLDIPAFNLGGFAASLGQYRVQEGQSATQIVGTFNPEDCTTGDCSDLDPDGDGFRVYGNAEADFNLSFTNTVKYKDFELSFLVHWKKGGDGVNLSTLLWDLAGLTWDYDDTDLDPEGVTPNGDYRTSEWFSGNAGPWIEDASYLRLREIGLYYNLPGSLFKDKANVRVGVSGRNLVNIFDYNSYDPEVSNFGGNVLANSIEVTPYPSSKRVNFHVKATF